MIQSPWRVAVIIYGSVLAYRKDKMPKGRVPRGRRDYFDIDVELYALDRKRSSLR